MQDTIIKGGGNSRTMKGPPNFLTLYPTYQDFAQALIDGTLPFDLGPLNPAGVDVMGTNLIKENLLQDLTCDILGISRESVINDAFLQLLIGSNSYLFHVHIEIEDGQPAEGASVSGLTAVPGGTLTSNKNGDVFGYATTKSKNISITSPYVNYQNLSLTVEASDRVLTNVSAVLKRTTAAYITITSSKNLKLSPDVKTYDLTAIGGGGGGGYTTGNNGSGGGGGGGGVVQHALGVISAGQDTLVVKIGSGGSAGTVSSGLGGTGGTTSVSRDGATLVSAQGGNGGTNTLMSGGNTSYGPFLGGTGNGNGGYGTGGNNTAYPTPQNGFGAVGYKFNDSTMGLAGGGGGGGGFFSVNSGAVASYGGGPNGARGALTFISISAGTNTNAGTAGIGGGGGGGCGRLGTYLLGSAGGAGAVYLRVHYS